MSYTLYDYTESLQRVGIAPEEVTSVPAAWGRSEEGYGEWSGGFLLELKDGTFAYVAGWCDTTGWGCQDGAEVHRFDTRPTLDALTKLETETSYSTPAEWDVEPADLNKWHADGCPADRRWE